MRKIVALSAFALLVFELAAGQSRAPSDTLVLDRPSNQWFEGPSTQVTISPDAQWALFKGFGGQARLYSLKTGHEDSGSLNAGLDRVETATFCGQRGLVRLGDRGSDKRWFLPDVESRQFSSIPLDAVFQCSADGSEIAYFRPGELEEGFFAGPIGELRNYQVDGRVTSMAFTPDGNALYAVVFRANGDSSLIRILPHSQTTRTIAGRLDASPEHGSIALAPDGRSIFIGLASDGAPNNEARHHPDSVRWLKIYQLDLATGARHVVAESVHQDNFDPAVIGSNLYWSRNLIRDSIVLVPAGGGDASELVTGGEVPMWSPDSKRIGYTFGGWRLADWALDLDAAVVGVDEKGQRSTAPAVIISGYHEDFPPAWSPDGKWIAFHSHRSKTPVPEYSSAGSTDDIYLRHADDVNAPEIRLTDFGWETGPAYWSPDGQKLLFSSWVRGGEPGIDKLWVTTVDLDLGRALRTQMLPLSAEIRSASWAAWSPDGKEIAIEDNRGGGMRSLWIVHSDGSHAEKLLDYQGTTYDGLDWTTDGKSIIYSGLAGDGLQLFSVPRAGGTPRQLTHDSGNLMHPRVSPDGRWIACTRIVQSRQIWRRPIP
ncbi:MAG: TolB family protein [Candidatus Acidiferrales bacterium]